MNKVFISGIVADLPALIQQKSGTAHLMFSLCVRHKTAKGVFKRELYPVNAWGSTALWAAKNLRQGQPLGVQGYLTQHVRENGMLAVEVTVEEFLPGMFLDRNARAEARAKAFMAVSEDAVASRIPETASKEADNPTDIPDEKKDAASLLEARFPDTPIQSAEAS